MNAPWLKEGVTILTRGHAEPSGSDGAGRTSFCVHGQHAFSGGGGGKSTSLLLSTADSIVGVIGWRVHRAKDRRRACGLDPGDRSFDYLIIESCFDRL